MTTQVLRIDASARKTGSVTRDLNDSVLDQMSASGEIAVTTRDLAEPLPLLTEDWIGANFTDPADRTDDQHDAVMAVGEGFRSG